MAFSFDIGSVIGGAISAAGSAKAVKRQINWERERAKNAHQWEVEDLKAAGLNPILSAGGQGAVTGSIDSTNTYEGYAEGISKAINNTIALKQLKMSEKKNNAEVDNINANTAQTLAMTPQLVKTQEYNRLTTPARYINNIYNLLKKMQNSENWKKGYKMLKNAGFTPKKEDILNTSFPFQQLKINKRTD